MQKQLGKKKRKLQEWEGYNYERINNMKITEITSQNRRDFYADIECEGCGAKSTISGYDDRNYHDNVIPNMKCKVCDKSRNDLNIVQEKTATKYADYEVV